MNIHTERTIQAAGDAFSRSIRVVMGQWESLVCCFCYVSLTNDSCMNPDCFMFAQVIPLPERKWVPTQ